MTSFIITMDVKDKATAKIVIFLIVLGVLYNIAQSNEAVLKYSAMVIIMFLLIIVIIALGENG